SSSGGGGVHPDLRRSVWVSQRNLFQSFAGLTPPAVMATARLDYVAPWWTYWLHNFPHFNLRFQPVNNTFQPEEASYQQSVIFLACVGAVGASLSLLVLAVYLVCLCCCRRKGDEDTKRPDTCCVTWVAVVTGLVICSAVGVGFYGNSQTNDGVYQLTYSLYSANHTLDGINSMVAGSVSNIENKLKQHLERLDEIFAARADYIQSLRFIRLMVNNIIQELTALPNISQTKVYLAAFAEKTAFIEYYRWLIYLLLLILDLVICLGMCLGISLTICQRSLTTMQIQIQGLLRFSVPVFPAAQRDLLGIQRLLNSTEFSVHQLTALLDCRGIRKDYLDALMGVCYDGVEGLLYLSLFSLLSACALSAMLCVIFRLWTLMGSREKEYNDIDAEDPFNPQARRLSYNPQRSNTHSFCSYISSLGSQASLHPPPQSTSNSTIPPPEYMNQSMLFGEVPRYENVPLIRRGSPPPSVRWPYEALVSLV
uniref:Protein tweety homolog n=1 Tax=Nothobranchius furzeri TaxID=105023 RepID=A0A8C6M103_NOTFU